MLNHLFIRCGSEIVGGILSLVNHDYKAVFQIDEALTLIKVDGRYLRSIMAVYSDEDQDTRLTKRKVIENTIQPLATLYGIREVKTAASIVRLVQGDVGVIKDYLYALFHWDIKPMSLLMQLLQPNAVAG